MIERRRTSGVLDTTAKTLAIFCPTSSDDFTHRSYANIGRYVHTPAYLLYAGHLRRVRVPRRCFVDENNIFLKLNVTFRQQRRQYIHGRSLAYPLYETYHVAQWRL